MNQPLLTKRQKALAHAKSRALERYSLQLTTADIRQIESDIKNGIGIVLIVRPRAKIILIRVKNRTCKIVYSTHSKTIVTFLPMTISAPKSRLPVGQASACFSLGERTK